MNLPEALILAIGTSLRLDEEDAQEIAEQVILCGSEMGLSGDEYYWPCRYSRCSREERDEAVRRDFNGRNLREVCAKHGLSHTTVYKIVKQAPAAKD